MPDETEYRAKRIADPIHGTIGLSQLEVELLSTQAFQRLRNVKQLGLAHLVFPGADYSRLSHSIGVNHVTARILEALRHNTQQNITDSEYKLYRLAGLMHDIGHYPFSHTFEDAVSTFYQTQSQPMLLMDVSNASDDFGDLIPSDGNDQTPVSLNHEDVGKLLLEMDREIKGVLENNQIDSRSIYEIFTRNSASAEPAPKLANLISSDLDADRVDYLLRTALHTGLPYGSVDIDYLLSQMRLDSQSRICLDPSALRTAEHFLLGRYFDYQQVNFHKTVAAFEWVLNDVIKELLKLKTFDCSTAGIQSMIASGKWYCFDDMQIWSLARDLERDTTSETIRVKCRAITQRIPPKLIGSFEFLGNRSDLTQYKLGIQFLSHLCDKLSSEFDIQRELWHVWGSWRMSFTKVGAYLPASMTSTDLQESADAIAQMVRIKDGADSKPITEIPRSLLRVLAQNALFSSRLYAILPSGKEALRSQIVRRANEEIKANVGLENWMSGE